MIIYPTGGNFAGNFPLLTFIFTIVIIPFLSELKNINLLGYILLAVVILLIIGLIVMMIVEPKIVEQFFKN